MSFYEGSDRQEAAPDSSGDQLLHGGTPGDAHYGNEASSNVTASAGYGTAEEVPGAAEGMVSIAPGTLDAEPSTAPPRDAAASDLEPSPDTSAHSITGQEEAELLSETGMVRDATEPSGTGESESEEERSVDQGAAPDSPSDATGAGSGNGKGPPSEVRGGATGEDDGEEGEQDGAADGARELGPADPHFPGGVVKIEGDYAVERFAENQDRSAVLADGTPITLPYTLYQQQGVRLDNPQAPEIREAQSSVDYDDLSAAEKHAVETALRTDELELHRTETLPEYRRLGLWRGETGESDRLYSVTLRDGFNRTMSQYPDHHGFVTSETEQQLDRPVEHAEPVCDGFMVTRYNGRYMYQATYRDTDPNFFGPEDEFANAFWIAGNPRTVRSASDPRLMHEDDGISYPDPRYTIVPVRFYKALLPKPGGDDSGGNVL